jgi:hypothetical protein
MPIVHFVPAAWYFLKDAVERGELASVRSCLERATRKHGERVVDCQDSHVNELRAVLREKAQVARARLKGTYEMNERWMGTLEDATEAPEEPRRGNREYRKREIAHARPTREAS